MILLKKTRRINLLFGLIGTQTDFVGGRNPGEIIYTRGWFNNSIIADDYYNLWEVTRFRRSETYERYEAQQRHFYRTGHKLFFGHNSKIIMIPTVQSGESLFDRLWRMRQADLNALLAKATQVAKGAKTGRMQHDTPNEPCRPRKEEQYGG